MRDDDYQTTPQIEHTSSTIDVSVRISSRERSNQMFKRHNDTIELLVQRLHAEQQYQDIQPFKMYSNKNITGEIDVFARQGHALLFYEVKANENSINYKKATEQFWKFCRAHPDEIILGFYVTPQPDMSGVKIQALPALPDNYRGN